MGAPSGFCVGFRKPYKYKLGFLGQRPSSCSMLKSILNFSFLEWLDQFILIRSSNYSIIYTYYSQIITKYDMKHNVLK